MGVGWRLESKGGDSSDYWKITKLGTPGGLEMERGRKNVPFPPIKHSILLVQTTFSPIRNALFLQNSEQVCWRRQMTILQKYSSHNYFQVEDYCFAFALLHFVFLMKIDLDFSKASDLMCPLMLTQPSLSAAKCATWALTLKSVSHYFVSHHNFGHLCRFPLQGTVRDWTIEPLVTEAGDCLHDKLPSPRSRTSSAQPCTSATAHPTSASSATAHPT